MLPSFLDYVHNTLPISSPPAQFIGEGAFATVTKVCLVGSHFEVMAVKSFRKEPIYDGEEMVKKMEEEMEEEMEEDRAPLDFLIELELLARLQHPNIITLYGAFSTDTHVQLLIPYVPRTLAKVLQSGDDDMPRNTISYLWQILHGAHYIHTVGYTLHRDLKTHEYFNN